MKTTRESIVLALVMIAITAVLVVAVRARPDTAAAADVAAWKWYTCTPAEVSAFSDRIHVRCAVPDGAIAYFAYPTRDANGSARYLSILSAAFIAGKKLSVGYDPADTSGPAFGCLASNCRPIAGLTLVP